MNDLPTNPRATSHADPQPWDSAPEVAPPHTLLIRELARTALFVVLIYAVFGGVIQNYQVLGQSMEPSFHTRQYIVVNRIIFFHFDANAPLRVLPGMSDLPQRVVYPFRTPQRGDVVIVKEPGDPVNTQPVLLIKRVIGLPGETIEIKDGRVYVDDQPLPEQQTDGGYLIDDTLCYGGALCQPYLVPAGSVVVMGDHRTNSEDSRSWGAEPGVSIDRILGKAWFRYWPQEDWGVIPDPVYAQPTP